MPNFFPHLSPRDQSIITIVSRLRQITGPQLERVVFSNGTDVSRGKRQRRAMARLAKLGHVRRLPRAVGGHRGGSGSYIYTPSNAASRGPNDHTLHVTELYVRLLESHRAGKLQLLSFDGEPYCHVQIGNLIYKPDARVHIKTKTGEYVWFIEQDSGVEFRTQLGEKMRRAVNAYKRWPRTDKPEFDVFPRVLWVVPDAQRQTFIESVIRRQEEPLFDTCLFEDALTHLSA